MIVASDILHWRGQVPWLGADEVEQDLVLSRLIIEIANHPLLGDELVFRGGTCFHKLWLDRPWRYSEDLDYVRRTAGGVGEILDAIREIAQREKTRTELRCHRLVARGDIPVLVRGRVRMFEDMAAHAGAVLEPALAARIVQESTTLLTAGWGRDHVGWVCEVEGSAVASAMVTLQPWLPHPRYPGGVRAYFHSVHTDPAHRGRGIARRLTETAIAWAR